jgi:hypothetical protein
VTVSHGIDAAYFSTYLLFVFLFKLNSS